MKNASNNRNVIELVLDAKSPLGEGALWDAKKQCLWWVDILSGRLHTHDPESQSNHRHEIGQMVGTVVACRSGGLMLAVEDGFASFDPSTSLLGPIHRAEPDKPNNRFNDGKCDPAGRFWAGTIRKDDANVPEAALYRLDPDLSIHMMLDQVAISNGIVWSADQKTMYYIDTPTRQVSAFDYDLADGSIGNRRTAVHIPKDLGWPDGMAIDAEDKLWVAIWGGACVARFDPNSGTMLSQINVPATQVTSCAFGGENLDDLYITTARKGLDKKSLIEQPLAGGLFKACPNVRGTRSFEFSG